jgi:hypothetical protein
MRWTSGILQIFNLAKQSFLLVLVFFVVACSSVQKAQRRPKVTQIEHLALEQFGYNYYTKANDSGSHILVFKKYKKMEDLMATIRFFIYDLETNSIIFQDDLKAGTVKWYSGFEVIAIARNLPIDSQEAPIVHRYYFNVLTKQKTIIK